MKVAVIGSRNLEVDNLQSFLPKKTKEIVSGGAKGIDLCAKNYATKHNIKYTEFLPHYNLYRRNAPLKRNLEIIEYSDFVLIFWDGKSRGTKFVIDVCKKIGKPSKVVSIIKSSPSKT